MSDPKSRRHASDVCGCDTREKLLTAAGEIFAEKGLHGASIRDITKRAGANIAAVNYYFRDKFELYTLVLRQAYEYIIEAGNRASTADTPEGRMRDLLSVSMTSMLNPARPAWQTLLIGRELFEPSPALDLMHDILQKPTHRLYDMIGDLRPDFNEQERKHAACAIIAQCVFYIHHRHIIRRLFPNSPESSLDVIVDQIIEFSLAALRGLGKTATADAGRVNSGQSPARKRRRKT